MIKNFFRSTGIDWADNSAISCSFWLISNETDGLFKLSLKPCCHTKKVMTIEIKAKVQSKLKSPFFETHITLTGPYRNIDNILLLL